MAAATTGTTSTEPAQVTPAQGALTKAKLPTSGKKAKPEDLNQELAAHVLHVAKTVGFRNNKFIEDAWEEEEITKDLIKYIPVDIGMPVEEFVEKYGNTVYEGIKAGRTDVQSNGKKRAQGAWDLL